MAGLMRQQGTRNISWFAVHNLHNVVVHNPITSLNFQVNFIVSSVKKMRPRNEYLILSLIHQATPSIIYSHLLSFDTA